MCGIFYPVFSASYGRCHRCIYLFKWYTMVYSVMCNHQFSSKCPVHTCERKYILMYSCCACAAAVSQRKSVQNALSLSNLTPANPWCWENALLPKRRVCKGEGFTLKWYWLTPALGSGTFHKAAYRNYSLARREQLKDSRGAQIFFLAGWGYLV